MPLGPITAPVRGLPPKRPAVPVRRSAGPRNPEQTCVRCHKKYRTNLESWDPRHKYCAGCRRKREVREAFAWFTDRSARDRRRRLFP